MYTGIIFTQLGSGVKHGLSVTLVSTYTRILYIYNIIYAARVKRITINIYYIQVDSLSVLTSIFLSLTMNLFKFVFLEF